MKDQALKKHDRVEMTVDALLFGGEGVGTVNGLKVFLPRSVPGDRWNVELTRKRSSYAEARGLELLKPSELRVQARCPYFDRCGGCSYQFLSPADQLRFKETQVRDALERIGGLRMNDFRPIVSTGVEFRYRNKMEFSFAYGADGGLELGMHPRGYHYEVLNLKQCFLVSERVESLMCDVRDWAVETGLEPWHFKRGGVLRSVIFRESQQGGLMMILQVQGEARDVLNSFARRFESKAESLYGQCVIQASGRRTQVEDVHLAGSHVLHEVLRLNSGVELQFEILPQSFFQTHSQGAELLYSLVVEMADLKGSESVLDLYCGTGTIGLFMASRAGSVLGVDLNTDSILNARHNADLNGISNAQFLAGDAAEVLKQESFSADVLVVDPPRAGLSSQALEQVLTIRAPRMIYVSCNPSTLARDLKILTEAGYNLKTVQAVDSFPQTSHVETVAQLELN